MTIWRRGIREQKYVTGSECETRCSDGMAKDIEAVGDGGERALRWVRHCFPLKKLLSIKVEALYERRQIPRF